MSKRFFDSIYSIYSKRGNSAYMIGEKITQTDHAIQSYRWMVKYGACRHLRVAAFLHDIGHLVVPHIDPTKEKKDDRHEEYGAEYLKNLGFSRRVYEPIRLHVKAKRYLISNHPETYYNKLSDASKTTLEIQGGKMSQEEMIEFRKYRFFTDSLSLRFCDDKSKDENTSPLSKEEIVSLEKDFCSTNSNNSDNFRIIKLKFIK